MESLFLIRNGEVNLQENDLMYVDTVDNFKLDGGTIPEDITNLDYAKSLNQCAINGEFFQPFPNTWAEEMFTKLPEIIEAKNKRLAPPEPTFDELVTAKHSELKSTMNQKREQLTVLYDNDNFNASTEAQNNMNSLLKAFDLGAENVGIRSATEVTHIFTQSQCNELALLMVSAVNSLYEKYWELKDNLANCKTKEEVEAIVWD